MRKNFGSQPWLYPMPVLIIGTYNEDGSPNAMNAAWGGIHDTDKLAVCIDPAHQTAVNFQRTRAFTVSIGTASTIQACDFVGLVSGKECHNKVSEAGLHAIASENVNAPLFKDLPMSLECRLISFDNQTGCTIAEIVNVSADEKILNDQGEVDPEKLEPILFDPVQHTYRKLGEIAGKAFAIGLELKKIK